VARGEWWGVRAVAGELGGVSWLFQLACLQVPLDKGITNFDRFIKKNSPRRAYFLDKGALSGVKSG
jgi:hypothetical protein